MSTKHHRDKDGRFERQIDREPRADDPKTIATARGARAGSASDRITCGPPNGCADLQLLREKEAAAILAVAPKTLRAWRVASSSRGPPFVKLTGSGGAVRYRIFDLREFIERGLRSSTSDDGKS